MRFVANSSSAIQSFFGIATINVVQMVVLSCSIYSMLRSMLSFRLEIKQALPKYEKIRSTHNNVCRPKYLGETRDDVGKISLLAKMMSSLTYHSVHRRGIRLIRQNTLNIACYYLISEIIPQKENLSVSTQRSPEASGYLLSYN